MAHPKVRPILYDENQDDHDLLEHYVNEEYGIEMWYAPWHTLDLGDRIEEFTEEQAARDENLARIRALLAECVNDWNIVVPKTFKTKDADGNRVPHPLAGQPAPVTLEWMEKIPRDVAIDAAIKIANHLAGRSPEEEDDFPGADSASPVPEDRGTGAGEADGDAGTASGDDTGGLARAAS